MQVALVFPAVLPVKGTPAASRSRAMARVRVPVGAARMRTGRVRATVVAAEVDYSSTISVFPMEACDLIGGEACNAQMYPEAKLAASASSREAASAASEVERDYVAYDEPKTVFPGEACDDLGGEFCEAPYQTGVSNDLSLASTSS